jgi:hypothetical protein
MDFSVQMFPVPIWVCYAVAMTTFRRIQQVLCTNWFVTRKTWSHGVKFGTAMNPTDILKHARGCETVTNIKTYTIKPSIWLNYSIFLRIRLDAWLESLDHPPAERQQDIRAAVAKKNI